jgi:benzoate membrane transport protein
MSNFSINSIRKDFSSSALMAGFLAVLISYSGPLLIFFQAANTANASAEMVASWVWGISIGAALSGIFLSIYLRVPVITAWSAPGTALLVTQFTTMSINQAVASYIVAAVIILIIGITGSFDRIIKHIPKGIAAAMIAGILFQFGISSFTSIENMPLLTISMILTYLVFKRFLPKYSVIIVLIVGVLVSMLTGELKLQSIPFGIEGPMFIEPEWDLRTTLNFAFPLILVSLTGQFLPGMAVLKSAGYNIKAKSIIVVSSLASIVVAFMGGITITLAAITAAICTSPESHENPDKRYISGIANGIFYLIGGIFSITIVTMIMGLPKELIAVLAGLALISAIANSLLNTVADEEHREASVITFLAVASGMSFAGIGSAFWGVIIGMLAHVIFDKKISNKILGLFKKQINTKQNED